MDPFRTTDTDIVVARGGGCTPHKPPGSLFSALPQPRVCEKVGGGFSTFCESKESENRNWQTGGRVPKYVLQGACLRYMMKWSRPKGEGGVFEIYDEPKLPHERALLR